MVNNPVDYKGLAKDILRYLEEGENGSTFTLLRKADAHWDRDELDVAIDLCDQAHKLACRNGNSYQQGLALMHWGAAYLGCGNSEKREDAIDRFRQASKVFHTPDHKLEEGVAWLALGMVYDLQWREEQKRRSRDTLMAYETSYTILTEAKERVTEKVRRRLNEAINYLEKELEKISREEIEFPEREVPPPEQAEQEEPPSAAPPRPGSYEVEIIPDASDRPVFQKGWQLIDFAIVGFVGIIMITTAAILATIATVPLTEDRRVTTVVFAATFVSSAIAIVVLVWRLPPLRMHLRVPPGHWAVIVHEGEPTVVPPGEAPGLLQPVYAIVPVGEITYSCRAHFLDSGTRERKIEQRIVVRYQIAKPEVATEWQLTSRADGRTPTEPLTTFAERQINTEIRIALEQIPLDAVEEKLANRVELTRTLGEELSRHEDHGLKIKGIQLGFCRIRK